MVNRDPSVDDVVSEIDRELCQFSRQESRFHVRPFRNHRPRAAGKFSSIATNHPLN